MSVARFGHFVRYCASAIHSLGLVPTCQWVYSTAQLNLKITMPRSLRVWPRFLSHPVKLRAGTSDPFVFRQIMIEKEYLPLNKVAIRTILDLGANIGLASAWFLSRFPDAMAFAVEAEKDNYATCCENLADYGTRARVLHAAAWSKRTTLTLRRRNCAADNLVQEVQISNSDQVEGLDLNSLIERSGFTQVDLLKIDIEGAEAEIFSNDVSSWLPRVRNLCIELHGETCRAAFFNALSGYDFEHSQSGELDLCTNLQPKPDLAHSA